MMRLPVTSLAIALGIPVLFSSPWVAQQSATTAEIRGLRPISASVVWASGTKGHVLRTTNGGSTWTTDTVPGAAQLDFRAIAPLDSNTAFAMSAGPAEQGQAKIFETTDGGTHWSLVYTTELKGVFLDALAFWDKTHGIALSDPVDGKLYLLRTDDGGHSWAHIPLDNAPPVLANEGAFAASGTCLTVYGSSDVWIATGGAEQARVFHSKDRGSTWTVANTPVHSGEGGAAGIFSVAFVDATHGIVVGGNYKKPRDPSDNVALSSDGGATWQLAKGPLPVGYMSAVAYLPGSAGSSLVAVGLGGTAVSNDGGQSWAMIDSIGYNSVAFPTKDAGWTAGPRGRIAKWAGNYPPHSFR